MVADGVKGKLVFVSSILGLMNFIGYSEYSPAKHAIRGIDFVSSANRFLATHKYTLYSKNLLSTS